MFAVLNPAMESCSRLTVRVQQWWMESRSSPRDKNGAYRLNQGMSEGGRRTKGEWQETKDSTKTELVVDNNLLWRSKAYSFGHFVRNLCGDPAHVQDTGSPLSHQRLLLIAARDMNLDYSLPILNDWQGKCETIRQRRCITWLMCN